jgi:hypothetical protein
MSGTRSSSTHFATEYNAEKLAKASAGASAMAKDGSSAVVIGAVGSRQGVRSGGAASSVPVQMMDLTQHPNPKPNNNGARSEPLHRQRYGAWWCGTLVHSFTTQYSPFMCRYTFLLPLSTALAPRRVVKPPPPPPWTCTALLSLAARLTRRVVTQPQRSRRSVQQLTRLVLRAPSPTVLPILRAAALQQAR